MKAVTKYIYEDRSVTGSSITEALDVVTLDYLIVRAPCIVIDALIPTVLISAISATLTVVVYPVIANRFTIGSKEGAIWFRTVSVSISIIVDSVVTGSLGKTLGPAKGATRV